MKKSNIKKAMCSQYKKLLDETKILFLAWNPIVNYLDALTEPIMENKHEND